MIYLIESSDRHLLQEKIVSIQNEYHISKENIEYFDAKASIESVLQSLYNLSFFSKKKIVIYENAPVLDTDSGEWLLNYIQKPNDTVIFVLACNRIDGRKKLIQQLKKQVCYIVLEQLQPKTKSKYIKSILHEKNIKLATNLENLMIQKLPCNAGIIQQEISKLSTYPDTITKEVIEDLIVTYYEDSIFEFVDVVLQDSVSKKIEYYKRIIEKQHPMQLIGVLASKIRLLYQVKHFSQQKNEQQLCEYLNAKLYPIQLALKTSLKYNEKQLLQLLNELGKLSYEIRHGLIDPFLGLEMFILKKGNYEVN